MSYPKIPDLDSLTQDLVLYSQLKYEYGSEGIDDRLAKAAKCLKQALREIKGLPENPKLAEDEPDDLKSIRALRPGGRRKLWEQIDGHGYTDRLEGAFIGRCAGCTLGAPVEHWSIDRMKAMAGDIGQAFPPVEYWKDVNEPLRVRYGKSRLYEYTSKHMKGIPVDDDISYTLLGLLIAEEYGPDFTTGQVAKSWTKYLPMAYTAEEVTLENLKNGACAMKAAEKNNPYIQWIGADIRSDPWAYIAPGWPEKAAEMAYRDAYLSHRRNGVYGAMYFAAAISAAFAMDDPVKALHAGLEEIPRKCATAKAIRWALKKSPAINNYKDAREAVDVKFRGMHRTHTINNACLTVFGITIGQCDFTKVISQTVAMGMDNDCTAATAGSIVGAVIGKKNIPSHWHKAFNNTVHSYLNTRPRFTITGIVKRFEKQARSVFSVKRQNH